MYVCMYTYIYIYIYVNSKRNKYNNNTHSHPHTTYLSLLNAISEVLSASDDKLIKLSSLPQPQGVWILRVSKVQSQAKG